MKVSLEEARQVLAGEVEAKRMEIQANKNVLKTQMQVRVWGLQNMLTS